MTIALLWIAFTSSQPVAVSLAKAPGQPDYTWQQCGQWGCRWLLYRMCEVCTYSSLIENTIGGICITIPEVIETSIVVSLSYKSRFDGRMHVG